MWLIRLASMLAAILLATPADAQWRRAESPNFILYGDMPERELRERILRLEDFDRLMRVATSVTDPPSQTRLHVYFVHGIEELRAIRTVDPSVAGYYIATSEGIAAFVRTDRQAGRGDETLLHEYAHHFMRHYAPAAYPAWYVEGFAEYFMTVRFAERHIDIGNFSRGRVYGLQGPWLPLDVVLSRSPDELTGEARAQFYVQSWVLTHYFFSNRERQQALSRYLAAARRMNPGAALEAATGMTGEAFTRELRRYINDGAIEFRRMPRGSVAAPPPVQVTVLPPSSNAMMVYDAALRVGIVEAERPAKLQQIRAAAARFPNDPLAARILAQAELLYGDRDVAARLLEGLTGAQTSDAELLYLRGRLHLARAEDGGDDGEARAALQWLERAEAADPGHWQTLVHSSQARARVGGRGADAADLLLRAEELAPQVASIRLDAARRLLQRGAVAEAIRLLIPLAADPHDGGAAAEARRLLADLTAAPQGGDGDGPAADKPPPPTDAADREE